MLLIYYILMTENFQHISIYKDGNVVKEGNKQDLLSDDLMYLYSVKVKTIKAVSNSLIFKLED